MDYKIRFTVSKNGIGEFLIWAIVYDEGRSGPRYQAYKIVFEPSWISKKLFKSTLEKRVNKAKEELREQVATIERESKKEKALLEKLGNDLNKEDL